MNDIHPILVRTLLQLSAEHGQEFSTRLVEWMERAGTTQELCDELTSMTQLYGARIEELLTLSSTDEADQEADQRPPSSPADHPSGERRPNP